MDRGEFDDDEKPPLGDGNNGCGNDADREDDNNGWCGQPPTEGEGEGEGGGEVAVAGEGAEGARVSGAPADSEGGNNAAAVSGGVVSAPMAVVLGRIASVTNEEVLRAVFAGKGGIPPLPSLIAPLGSVVLKSLARTGLGLYFITTLALAALVASFSMRRAAGLVPGGH